MKFQPNTRLSFYIVNNDYIKGEGIRAAWEAVKTQVTADMETAVFYCEWRGGFGGQVFSAFVQGVNDFATIRMIFNPQIYDALSTKRAIVAKNADADAIKQGKPNSENINCYEIWGAVDNAVNDSRFMEFKVRRYEAK